MSHTPGIWRLLKQHIEKGCSLVKRHWLQYLRRSTLFGLLSVTFYGGEILHDLCDTNLHTTMEQKKPLWCIQLYLRNRILTHHHQRWTMMAECQVGKLRGKPMDQPPTQSSICAVHCLVTWFVLCVTIKLYCWYQILRRCQLVYKFRQKILKVEHDQLGSNNPNFQCKLNAPRTGLRPPAPHVAWSWNLSAQWHYHLRTQWL